MADKNYDDLIQLASDESTVDDSLIALVTGIKGQLDGVLAGTVIPTAVQTKIDAIFDSVTANKDKVAAAVLANTPQDTGATS